MASTSKPAALPALQFEFVYTNALTRPILAEAASFFSTHFGTYSSSSPSSGQRITISPSELKSSIWPEPAKTGRGWQDQCLIQAYLDPDGLPSQTEEPTLVGQAFVTKWRFKDRPVLWITQLIVHSEYRRRGIARAIVEAVKEEEPVLYQPDSSTLVGVNGSHPATLIAAVSELAATRSFSDALSNGSQEMKDVEQIIQAGPLERLKNSLLIGKGGAGEDQDSSLHGHVKVLQTDLLVDNTGAQQLVASMAAKGIRLPELSEGGEYVIVFDGI